jgi:hypothetical protein
MCRQQARSAAIRSSIVRRRSSSNRFRSASARANGIHRTKRCRATVCRAEPSTCRAATPCVHTQRVDAWRTECADLDRRLERAGGNCGCGSSPVR